MAYRLLQALLPGPMSDADVEGAKQLHLIDYWQVPTVEGRTELSVIVDAGAAESVAEWLTTRHGSDPGFRINLLTVEATNPVAESIEEPDDTAKPVPEEEAVQPPIPLRVSRDELMADLTEATHLSRIYVILAFISAMVAAGGILKDNVAVVIGAMVIAPLLGPNVALCLATTLADYDLAKSALKANALGVLTAFVPSVALGMFVHVDPEVREIASRTVVGIADVAIALASGTAGVIAFTSGASTALIGVMVAVALMPPLVTFGLLIGSGQFALAGGALLLLSANVICVNLAGVLTFSLQGIRPANWWEAKRAGKATRLSLAISGGLLLLLILVILISRGKI